MQSDLSYFSQRADEELRAATEARDGRSRRAHLELASRYDDLAQGIMAHDRSLYGYVTEPGRRMKERRERAAIWL